MAGGTPVKGVQQLQSSLGQFQTGFHSACLAGARAWAANLQNAMQSGAPWRDRTSHARNSLQAAADIQGDIIRVVASGGMTYSPFLEVRWGGKYAIILKTMIAQSSGLLKSVQSAVKGMGL